MADAPQESPAETLTAEEQEAIALAKRLEAEKNPDLVKRTINEATYEKLTYLAWAIVQKGAGSPTPEIKKAITERLRVLPEAQGMEQRVVTAGTKEQAEGTPETAKELDRRLNTLDLRERCLAALTDVRAVQPDASKLSPVARLLHGVAPVVGWIPWVGKDFSSWIKGITGNDLEVTMYNVMSTPGMIANYLGLQDGFIRTLLTGGPAMNHVMRWKTNAEVRRAIARSLRFDEDIRYADAMPQDWDAAKELLDKNPKASIERLVTNCLAAKREINELTALREGKTLMAARITPIELTLDYILQPEKQQQDVENARSGDFKKKVLTAWGGRVRDVHLVSSTEPVATLIDGVLTVKKEELAAASGELDPSKAGTAAARLKEAMNTLTNAPSITIANVDATTLTYRGKKAAIIPLAEGPDLAVLNALLAKTPAIGIDKVVVGYRPDLKTGRIQLDTTSAQGTLAVMPTPPQMLTALVEAIESLPTNDLVGGTRTWNYSGGNFTIASTLPSTPIRA